MHFQNIELCDSRKDIDHLYQRKSTLEMDIERSGKKVFRVTFVSNDDSVDDLEGGLDIPAKGEAQKMKNLKETPMESLSRRRGDDYGERMKEEVKDEVKG